jgi:hypothetical protein
MSDVQTKISGIYTQIQQLKKRLKETDAIKIDPRELSSVVEALEKLEGRLEKQNEKKKQRQLEKETKEKELVQVKESTETKPEVTVESNNGPSDEDVQQKAWEMFKQHWDALSSSQQDEVYKALGVNSTAVKVEDKVVVEAPQIPIIEVPKEATVELFALDSIVEPVKGTPGSYGRVMRSDPDLVYVLWEGGKLKETHNFGAYAPEDLKKKATTDVNTTPLQTSPLDVKVKEKVTHKCPYCNRQFEKWEDYNVHRKEHLKPEEKKAEGTEQLKVVDQTPPQEGDPSEDPAMGYGGDRPGVWVEPKAAMDDIKVGDIVDGATGNSNVKDAKVLKMIAPDVAEVQYTTPGGIVRVDRYYTRELRKSNGIKCCKQKMDSKSNLGSSTR